MMADGSLLGSGGETWGPVSPDNVHETGVWAPCTAWIPRRGGRGRASQANSKKDLVTGRIQGFRALHSLEEQSPDVIISAGSSDDEVVLARALLGSGLRVKAIGLAAAAMQKLSHALGTHAEGFLGPSQWEPRPAYFPDFGPGPAEARRVHLFRSVALPAGFPIKALGRGGHGFGVARQCSRNRCFAR